MADLTASAGGPLELTIRGVEGLTPFAQVIDTPSSTVVVARIPLPPVTGKPWLYSATVAAPAAGVYTVLFDQGDPDDENTTAEASLEVTGAEPVIVVVSPVADDVYTDITGVRQILSPDGSTDPTLGTAASLSDGEIQEAINEAASEINARLAARYTVPFTEAPPLVEKLNRDIAAYLATLTYRRGDPIDPNDPVQKRYDRAQSLLASIQSGKTELVVADGEVTSEQSEAVVINPYDGDMFTLEGFGIGETPYRVWPWEPV